MRTTLNIDDDVLAVVKDLAKDQHLSTGKLVSNLLRTALQTKTKPQTLRNGILLLRRRPGAPPTTLAEVNRLRDD